MNYPKNRYTGIKPWMNKEWLYNQYIEQDKSSQKIADEYGCKQNTIQYWLLKHNIKKQILTHVRKNKKQHECYDYLYKEYIELGKSIQQIANECCVDYDTIRYHLKKQGIELIHNHHRNSYNEDDVQRIISLYCDEMLSANQIAKLFHTNHCTIINILQRNNIDTRSMSDSQLLVNRTSIPDEFYDANILQKWHWEDGKSCNEIGLILGMSAGTVRRQMHRLGLSTKNNSEAKIGQMVGELHPNWQGGRTALKQLLREYFHVNQVPKIAKRDNYTCQLCGATHTVLHVHHIISFGEIVDEICNENNNLNPDNIDDRQKLYKIITNDSRFLNENNLITFCKECHYFEIHDFKRKTISSQASIEEGSETIPQGSTL